MKVSLTTGACCKMPQTTFCFSSLFIEQIFGFWVSQRLKLSRSACFRVFKSYFLANFHVIKPERVALSKFEVQLIFSIDTRIIMTSSQSASQILITCRKWFTNNLPGKLWSAFLFELRLLENATFSLATEMPTKREAT